MGKGLAAPGLCMCMIIILLTKVRLTVGASCLRLSAKRTATVMTATPARLIIATELMSVIPRHGLAAMATPARLTTAAMARA